MKSIILPSFPLINPVKDDYSGTSALTGLNAIFYVTVLTKHDQLKTKNNELLTKQKAKINLKNASRSIRLGNITI